MLGAPSAERMASEPHNKNRNDAQPTHTAARAFVTLFQPLVLCGARSPMTAETVEAEGRVRPAACPGQGLGVGAGAARPRPGPLFPVRPFSCTGFLAGSDCPNSETGTKRRNQHVTILRLPVNGAW